MEEVAEQRAKIVFSVYSVRICGGTLRGSFRCEI